MNLKYKNDNLSEQDRKLLQQNTDTIIDLGLHFYKLLFTNIINLTRTERILFEIFTKNKYCLIPTKDILKCYNKSCFGNNTSEYITISSLVTKITRLNKKLEPNGVKIQSVYSLGYMLITK